MPVAIGVDIGGGSTKIGLVDSDGVLRDRVGVPNQECIDADALTDRYFDAVDAILRKNEIDSPIGIGIGYPGHIGEDGMTGDRGNVGALDNYPLAERFAHRFGCPSHMDNDAAVAALAEARHSSVGSEARLLLITIGTGIGVGFVAGSKPNAAMNRFLWDAGHMIVDADQRYECRLGCRGCLESVSSANALLARATTLTRENPDVALSRYAHGQGALHAADVVRFSRDGDPLAQQLLKSIGRWIGMAAASWCHMLSVTDVRIGGGLSAAGSVLVDEIERQARIYASADRISNVRFSTALLGNDAGMIGAAGLIFSNSNGRTDV